MEFKNFSALQQEVNRRAGIAVQNVARIMVEELRNYLSIDFYAQYDPLEYQRTYQLANSPSYEMLSQNMAKIFIDSKNLRYKTITGDEVAHLTSLGFHGGYNIFRPGFFWKDFVEWANNNVPRLLKEELRKQGLNIK